MTNIVIFTSNYLYHASFRFYRTTYDSNIVVSCNRLSAVTQFPDIFSPGLDLNLFLRCLDVPGLELQPLHLDLIYCYKIVFWGS